MREHVTTNDQASGRTLRFVQAVNEALDLAMASDKRVFLFGEDITDPSGGIMQATLGLSTKYGPDRVRETPIAEQAILGLGIGAAIGGLRPVAEIMIMDFLAVCLDQLANHAAKLRYMSGGQTAVPLTVRCTAFGGRQFAAQHSQMLEAWLIHIPGLKVVIPSTPSDAKGLLTACIVDEDPCVFVEMTALYQTKGDVPEGYYKVPLGSADVKVPGTDVTVITYGKQVHDVIAVAAELSDRISVEVVDLRSLIPLDEATVLDSARKTRRVVIVHQAVERGGFGAELSTRLYGELGQRLAAPIVRVAGRNTPVPYAKELEDEHLPSAARIKAGIERVMNGW